MKFYSEELNKIYDTQEALEKAEKDEIERREKAELAKKKLSEERSARAKEVEAAQKAVIEANNKYRELLNQFIEDYGHYHYSINEKEKPIDNFWDIFGFLI